MIASTIAFNDATPDTITDSASNFLKKGFKSGDTITVSGASNAANNATFTAVTVTAGTITLASGVVLTAELEGASVTITADSKAKNQPIADGVEIVLKGHPDNTGTLYLANSATNASSSSLFMYPLEAGEALSLQVKSLNAVWVNASVSGDKIIISHEI